MPDNLVKTLQQLVRKREALRVRERRLERRERQMIESLRQLLPHIGYRLVLATGSGRTGGTAATSTSGKPKHLRCPRCERRFAHPLPLARHLSATHGVRLGSKRSTGRPRRRRKAKQSKKS